MLGKRQLTNNEDWFEAISNIENIVSREELNRIEAQTIKEIKLKTSNKKVAFAWSGGKDSIVLEHICRKAGIEDCMLAICNLEYPAFIEWVKRNKPRNLEIINTGQDIDWLSRNLHMLFPQSSNVARIWYSIVQHRGQEKYYKNNNLDILILGRRKQDMNYVGKGSNIYTTKKNITRYSPLADWKHEHVLAYIHYYNLELPPFYHWKNGFKCGTHPWPARQYTDSIENGWREVYEIDKRLVIAASKKIESARNFLSRRNAL